MLAKGLACASRLASLTRRWRDTLTDDGYMELDVAALPREQQFAAWASAMPAYTVTTARPERGFEAKVRVWLVPPVAITVSHIGPARWQRTAEAAIRDGLDSLTFQLVLSGRTRGMAGGTPFQAGGGDVTVQDAALAIESVTTRMSCVTVTMPRAFLDEAAPGLDVHGAVLRGGLGALLASFLRALPDALDGAEAADAAAIPRLLRELLVASLPAHPGAVQQVRPLRDRVRRYVAANLHRPLTVDVLRDAVGGSRAALYRAFEERGGVMAFVLEQRLLRARRLLADPVAPRSVAETAAATGFRDSSELGRAYRRRFGTTPGSARRADPTKPAPAGPVQERFRTWIEAGG